MKTVDRKHYPILDYFRLGLASTVVLIHLHLINAGSLSFTPVPVFLAISGFVISGSLRRSGATLRFWFNRAIRLLPAFFLSFVLVAALFGLQGVEDAFKSWGTFGIYQAKPASPNSPLWSLSCEEVAYMLFFVAAAAGLVTKRSALAFGIFSASALIAVAPITLTLARPPFMQMPLLFAFAIGIAASYFKAPRPIWAGLAFTGYLATTQLGPEWCGLGLVLACISALWLGQMPLPERFRLKSDLSYGVYIYHCPIMLWLLPMFGRTPNLWVLTSALTFAVAYLSYRFLERPLIDKRDWLFRRVAQRRELTPACAQ